MLWLYEFFLSRGLDRLPSLLANQSRRYQNHSASRAPGRRGQTAPGRGFPRRGLAIDMWLTSAD